MTARCATAPTRRASAPADQHKFGPLAPLPDNLKRLKDRLLKASGR